MTDDPNTDGELKFNFDLWRELLQENKALILATYKTKNGNNLAPHQFAGWIGHDRPPKVPTIEQVAAICGVPMNSFWS